MTTLLPIEALDHVALTVSDPDRSMQWYQDVLGFKPASMEGLKQGPPYLLRVAEGNYLNLFPSDSVPMKSVPDHSTVAMRHMLPSESLMNRWPTFNKHWRIEDSW